MLHVTSLPVSRSLLSALAFLPIALATQCAAIAQDQPSISMITGENHQGVVDSIAGGAVTGSGIPEETQLSAISVIRTGRATKPGGNRPQVYLGGGGQINVPAVQFDGENFSFSTDFGSLDLAPESVRGVVFKPTEDLDLFRSNLANPSGENDRVIAETSSGQQMVAGLLESIDSDKLNLNYKGESRTISLSKIVAVILADLKPSPLSGTICNLRMLDGSTLSGNVIQLQGNELQFSVIGGKQLNIDWNQVNSVTVRSDRLTYLSDLEPIDTEQTPLATIPFPWQRDASVSGKPMTLNYPDQGMRKTFDKGIGMHASARLVFENAGQFDRLVATVGIDAATGGHGDCQVLVRADGIELWSEHITGKTTPKELDVDISGMRTIELIVQAGAHLDLGDHVDWANARFIKTQN